MRSNGIKFSVCYNNNNIIIIKYYCSSKYDLDVIASSPTDRTTAVAPRMGVLLKVQSAGGLINFKTCFDAIMHAWEGGQG